MQKRHLQACHQTILFKVFSLIYRSKQSLFQIKLLVAVIFLSCYQPCIKLKVFKRLPWIHFLNLKSFLYHLD